MEDKDSLEDSIPVWVLRPSTVEALATQLNPQKILLSDSGMERDRRVTYTIDHELSETFHIKWRDIFVFV